MDKDKNNLPSPNSEEWMYRTFNRVVMQMYQTQRTERIWSWIWRILKLLFWLAVVSLIFKSSQKTADLSETTGAHTALINLSGEINSTNDSAKILTEGLEKAYKSPNLEAIIINANSPGGSPVIAETAYDQIRYFKTRHPKIPIYTVVGDVCASGCYYIASATDKIFASASSLVGSIGVISNSFGVTGLMQKLGIQRRLHVAGKYKGMGDPFSPETPAEVAIWQDMLNDIHGQFIDAVKRGRGKRLLWQQYPDVFSGRVYTGDEAKKIGLIDDYGNVYSVSRDVIKASKIVNYTPRDNLVRILSRQLGAEARDTISSLTSEHW